MSRLCIEDLRYHNCGPIDLIIGPSECVCLSGPSGSGKTLMLRAIADLDSHGGRVLLGDVEDSRLSAPEWRRRVGLLPAESQWWHDTVGDHFSGIETAWLHTLGFNDGVMAWQVSRLSTGERQRLALLRLLGNRPEALLLDEPTASLDPDNVRRAEELIAAYRQEGESPVLWISHDPEQIRRVADRSYRMNAGRITQQGQ